MKSWVDVVRDVPGLPNNEVFADLKYAAGIAFKEVNSEDCKCVTIHTNYPTDDHVVFGMDVEAPTEQEAIRIAERQCDLALSRIGKLEAV